MEPAHADRGARLERRGHASRPVRGARRRRVLRGVRQSRSAACPDRHDGAGADRRRVRPGVHVMLGSASRTLRDGIAAALARDFDSAHQLLQRATTESPTDIRAWLWRAIASPTPSDAIACLRRVLVFEPTHPEAQQGLARLLAAQANGLAAGGQKADAVALAREAAGLAPDCDAVWLSLATLSEDPQERLDALRRANDLSPHATQTRMLLRDTLLHAGIAAAAANPDAARTYFREASTVDPADPRVWQALARMATTAAEALTAHRELFKLAPDRPNIRAALKRALTADAEACTAAGLSGEAVERWREAVALDEQDPAAWLGLAAATSDRDEALRALAVVNRAGLDDPRVAALTARWQTDEASSDPLESTPFTAPSPTFAPAPAPFGEPFTPLPSPSPFAAPPPPPAPAVSADPVPVTPYAPPAPF